MNRSKSILLLSIFLILQSCTAMVSSEHNTGHHRHNRVSVGIHSHGSGGGLGALIVGGIIGAIINEASHTSNEKQLEKKKLEEKQTEEKLIKEQKIQESADRERLTSNSQVTKWYQLGKDKQCYEMQTQSGITDVLASVDIKYCNP